MSRPPHKNKTRNKHRYVAAIKLKLLETGVTASTSETIK